MDLVQIAHSAAGASVAANPLWKWVAALILAAVLYFFFNSLQRRAARAVHRYAEHRRNMVLVFFSALLEKTARPFIFVLAIYGSINLALEISPSAEQMLKGFVLLAIFSQAAFWTTTVIDFFFTARAKLDTQTPASGYAAIAALCKTAVWVIALLLILDNFGVNVTSLVAGLGIGGVAVALAVQNILGDVLCSLSIVLDKPFKVGDFIIVDNNMGVVELIGLKSTRIKSITGEQLIFSNTDLIKSRIRNFQHLYERRICFSLGVVYSTPYEKMEKIPAICREIIEALPDTRFDRAHFKEFGPYSLNIEIVYFVLNPDYAAYMDTQQRINFAIMRAFAAEGIEFAFPSQTVYLYPTPGADLPQSRAKA